MSPKRGAYPQEFRQTAIRMLRAGRDPRELAQELGVTPTTLHVWLHIAETGSHRGDRSREMVLSLTTQAYERLDGFLRTLPKSAMEVPMSFSPKPLDPWRVKDAVAHVTHYKARVIQRLIGSGSSAGGPKSAADRAFAQYWNSEDWAELRGTDVALRTFDKRTRRRHGGNHLVYLRWRDRSATEILAWHRFVQKYIISTLKSGPDSWFLPEWQRASRESLSYEAIAGLSAHSDQHLRDMQRALAS